MTHFNAIWRTKRHRGMVNIEPRVDPEGHYSLKETYELLGISRSTLRRYVKDRRIRTRTHRETGRSLVTGKEIRRFWKSIK